MIQQSSSKSILLGTILNFVIVVNIGCTTFITKNESELSDCYVNQVYSSEGELKIGLILNNCVNSTSASSASYKDAADWTITRLNTLNSTSPLRLGLSVFEVCTEYDYYNPIFKIFKQEGDCFFLGTISNENVPSKIQKLAEVLDVQLGVLQNYRNIAVEAAVKLLRKLDLMDNITVIAENHEILRDFYDRAKQESICVKNSGILGMRLLKADEKGSLVVFGRYYQIKTFIGKNLSPFGVQTIFVSFDKIEANDFPEGSYIIEPSNVQEIFVLTNDSIESLPTPLLFEVANPIFNLVSNLSNFIEENCNETAYKTNCLRNKFPKPLNKEYKKIAPFEIARFLKFESHLDKLAYKVFRVENFTLQSPLNDTFQSFVDIFAFNIINKTLVDLENIPEDVNATNESISIDPCLRCKFECLNYHVSTPPPKSIVISYSISNFGLRPESWIFAILSVAVLGVVFCVAILIFFIVRFCRRDILEGNPLLTLLLLLSVVFMYCSVIPFTFEGNREFKNSICLSRALSTTLSFAFALSLLLARSILLAASSKEVGFMSHVAGPVQSFLTLFIFGVQSALSLQFINHCEDIFRGISFVYLMSYNIILLVLLVFICPLNTRVHRNYKEGKYFTVAVILIAFAWSCWIPGYAVLENEWRDPALCFGLISTASILLGTIFIPRTYKMTVAAARDRLNVFPPLPATSSILDVYRASTQPVYDCINIAAINATTVARNGGPPPPPPPQTEIYSSLPTPYEEDFDFERCITPSTDKVTRF